jgi:hypothetical protein
MRPAKSILILTNDEAQASVLGYILRNSRPARLASLYQVTEIIGAADALECLTECSFDLLIALCPVAQLSELLAVAEKQAPFMPRLVLAGKGVIGLSGFVHDPVLTGADMATTLERIAVLTKRKRGPRRKLPLPVSAPRPRAVA